MIPNGVSVLRSRAPVYPMHNEEVGLIEEKKSGSSLLCPYTSSRSLRGTFLSLPFVPRLDGMRVDDCPNESGKALLEFRTTRGIVDFHAATFTTDQPRLSQFPKMLRECGLRDRLVADGEKRRAVLRALLRHDVRINGHSHRVAQSVENSFYRNLLNRWVEQRPHAS